MHALASDPAATLPARLPHGLWRDGAPLRELRMRPASQHDHAFLLDTLDAGMTPGARGTALLARCLEDAPPGAAQALGAGDREALLLQLRQLSHGDAMTCVLRCPSAGCGEPLELALRVSELLLPEYADAAPEYALQVAHDDADYALRFRLPNAGDLDQAAAIARDDGLRAGAELLARCILEARADGTAIDTRALPEAVHDAVAAAIAERDPQAGIEFAMTCPVCAHAFVAELDAASLLLEELDARAQRSLREVHVLASQYGWSEREILAMPAQRRARYIELIGAMRRTGSDR
jgi:hypothetical protein